MKMTTLQNNSTGIGSVLGINNHFLKLPLQLKDPSYSKEFSSKLVKRYVEEYEKLEELLKVEEDPDIFEELDQKQTFCLNKLTVFLVGGLHGGIRVNAWELIPGEIQRRLASNFVAEKHFVLAEEVEEIKLTKQEMKTRRGVRKYKKQTKVQSSKHTPYWDVERYPFEAKSFTLNQCAKMVLNYLLEPKTKISQIRRNREVVAGWLENMDVSDAIRCLEAINPSQIKATSKFHDILNEEKVNQRLYHDRNHNVPRIQEREDRLRYLDQQHDEMLAKRLQNLQEFQATYSFVMNEFLECIAEKHNLAPALRLLHSRLLTTTENEFIPVNPNMDPFAIMCFWAQIVKIGFPDNFSPLVMKVQEASLTDQVEDIELEHMRNYFSSPKSRVNLAKSGFYTRYEKYVQMKIQLATVFNDDIRFKKRTFNDQLSIENAIIYVFHHQRQKRRLHLGDQIPTMFSSGQAINDVRNVAESTRQFVEKAAEVLEENKDYPKVITERIELLATRLEEIMINKDKATDETLRKINDLLDRAAPTVDAATRLAETGGDMLSGFATVAKVFEVILGSLKNFIPDTYSKLNISTPKNFIESINLSDVSGAIILYIMYKNTESKILKGIYGLMILRKLGILDLLVPALMKCKDMLCELFTENGTSWSDDITGIIQWVFDSVGADNIKIVGAIAMVIIAIISGTVIRKKDHIFQLGANITNTMRNIGFISMGLGGGERIFNYAKTLMEVCIKYVRQYILKQDTTTPEEILRKKAERWMMLVEIYSQEVSLAVCRLSKKDLDAANQLLPEGLVMQPKITDLKDPALRGRFADCMKKAKIIANSIYRMSQTARPRITPFHVQFVGEPGVGKSTLIDLFCEKIRLRYYPARPETSGIRYARSDTAFWDGYEGNPVYIIDDFACITDPKEVGCLLTLISNVPIQVPMAHLEDKGRYFTSEFVLSTTNTAYPNVEGISCPDAIWRRRHLLVETFMDKRVRHPTTRAVDARLFEKFYPNQNMNDFPHCTFALKNPLRNSYITDPKYYEDLFELPPPTRDGAIRLTLDQIFQIFFRKRDTMANIECTRFKSLSNRDVVIKEWNDLLLNIASISNDEDIKEHIMSNSIIRANSDLTLEQKIRDKGLSRYIDEIADDEDIRQLFDEEGESLVEQVDEYIAKATEAERALAQEQNDLDFDHPPSTSQGTMDIESEKVQNLDDLFESLNSSTAREEPESDDNDTASYMTANEHTFDFTPLTAEEVQARAFHILGKKGKAMPSHSIQLNAFPQYKWYNSQSYVRLMHDYTYQYCDIPVLETVGRFPVYTTDPKKSPWCDRNATAHNPLSLPVIFLAGVKKIDNEWIYDHTVFNEYIKDLPLDRPVHEALKPWTIDFMRRAMDTFLMDLSESQRVYLSTKFTKWYSLYYYLKQSTKNLVKGFGDILLDLKNSPYTVFMDTLQAVILILTPAVFLMASIAFFSVIGKLILGPQETSKVMFQKKGAHQPKILYTSEERTNKTSQVKKHLTVLGTITADGRSSHVNAIGFDGHWILTVQHFVDKLNWDGDYAQISYLPDIRSDNFTRVWIQKWQVVPMHGSDACLIYVDQVRMFPTAGNLFVNEETIRKHLTPELTHVFWRENTTHIVNYTASRILTNYTRTVNDKTYSDTTLAYCGCPVGGSSGGPILGLDKYANGSVIAIQSARQGSWGYATVITKEKIEELKGKVVFPEDQFEITSLGPLIATDEPTVMSKYVHPGTPIIGCIPEEYQHKCFLKTSFVKTPISGAFESERIPAILNPKDKRIQGDHHPIEHSINKFSRDEISPLDPIQLDASVKGVVGYIYERSEFDSYPVMSFEEAIRGLPEDGYSPVNLKTSMGLPYVLHKWPGKQPGKKAYIRYSQTGELEYVSSEFRKDFEEADLLFRSGVIPKGSSYDFMKDELRPVHKAIGPPVKTRSITVMPFSWTLVYRKYFLSFEAAMHNLARGTFQSCVGINPESSDWANLYRSLKSKSNFGFDLDVGNWDGHFPPDLFLAVVKTINSIMCNNPTCGDCRARITIAHAALFGYVQFEDTVYQKPRGMPSGFGGTAIFNTLGHMILNYYIYRILCIENRKFSYLPFQIYDHYVSIFLYGDDVITSVREEISDFYNGISVSQKYESLGWPVTMAEKSGGVVKFKPIEELQFLKRHFKIDDQYGLVVYGALEKGVINDLCYWMREQAQQLDQLYNNLNGALEFAYAHGKEYYIDLSEQINRALNAVNLRSINILYSDMRARMLARYFNQDDETGFSQYLLVNPLGSRASPYDLRGTKVEPSFYTDDGICSSEKPALSQVGPYCGKDREPEITLAGRFGITKQSFEQLRASALYYKKERRALTNATLWLAYNSKAMKGHERYEFTQNSHIRFKLAPHLD